MLLEIRENESLEPNNTLGLKASASLFCRVDTPEMLGEALAYAREKSLPVFILGGGSNVVFSGDYAGLVIAIDIKGIRFDGCRVTAMAGEVWHDFVTSTLVHGLSGLENLSMIPGLVGAAPIQNIGAYGVELAERLTEVTVMDRGSGKLSILGKKDCEFGYRDSVFKHRLENRKVVVSITLELDRDFVPRLEYADLAEYFADKDMKVPITPLEVASAVIQIRLNKLPVPGRIGNVGSFFKFPVVSPEKRNALIDKYPVLTSTSQSDGKFKLSAASLIDMADLKNTSVGGASVSARHALVLINNGNASGSDVIALAELVRAEVRNRFDLELEIEPVIVE